MNQASDVPLEREVLVDVEPVFRDDESSHEESR